MKRHRFNAAAGGMGLVFVILAVGFFLDAIDVWDAEVAWLAPVFLIAFGAAGVVSSVARGGRSDPPPPQFDPAWAGPPAAPPQPPSQQQMPPETPTDPWTPPESPTSEPEEAV
ncbi:MAG: hypothetical protein ABWZ15_08950 [Acidimicrobiia bacterium]